MIPGSLARRYAKALIELAGSAPQRDKLADDLDAFADLVRQRDSAGTMALAVLEADRFPVAERRQLIDGLLRRLGADPLLGKFLAHVLDRRRIDGVPQIARAYRRLADDAAGRMRATITSVEPMAADAVAKLKSALERATGKTVVVDTNVDPDLIGGVVTQVGGYVLDGSVRNTLQTLKQSLRHD